MIKMNPRPTTRFVLEPSLECNINPPCKFCYHLHKYDNWKNTRKSFDEVKKIIDDGKARGNDYMDITGGEPTMYPDIIKTLSYAHENGIRTCIITNGIVGKNKTKEILDTGINDFLVSRHGFEDTHNFITNTTNGYDQQIRFLNQISSQMRFRFNCVIHQFNYGELISIAEDMLKYEPTIINFINMNPHHEWMHKEMQTKEVVANLNEVEAQLNEIIPMCEAKGTYVNVRYYPMCRIDPIYRRCVCNDLAVMFDSYEWDYSTSPKTTEKYFEWGVNCSNANEEKGEPCCRCDLQKVCGGGNKHFHKVANEVYGEQFTPQKLDITGLTDIEQMWYYRQQNVGLTI